MPGSIGSSAPGTRTNPAQETSPSSNGDSGGSAPGGNVSGRGAPGGSAQASASASPTVPKAEMGEPDEKEESGPPPSVIRRAELPAPSELSDEQVYMATLKSGNTIPMTGRELKDTLLTDRPPPGALMSGVPAGGMAQESASGDSSNSSSNGSSEEEGNKWWQDVLLGIGRIGGIFLRDRLGGEGEELTEEEREALRRIAEKRRKERQRRKRRNRWLLIGGVVVIGGLGLWYATRSTPAPPPPPPPPPEPEPEPQEAEEVEITDAERSNPEHGAPTNHSGEQGPPAPSGNAETGGSKEPSPEFAPA